MNINLTDLHRFVAGFDLAGKRLPNGKLQAYLDDELLDDWPSEITFKGTTYTLEDVIKGNDGYESGVYV